MAVNMQMHEQKTVINNHTTLLTKDIGCLARVGRPRDLAVQMVY